MLGGEATCTREQVQQACAQHGIDPYQKGWLARQGPRYVEAFSPTPELVHGVVVASPLMAKAMRKAGVFSGRNVRLEGVDTDAMIDATATARSEHYVRQTDKGVYGTTGGRLTCRRTPQKLAGRAPGSSPGGRRFDPGLRMCPSKKLVGRAPGSVREDAGSIPAFETVRHAMTAFVCLASQGAGQPACDPPALFSIRLSRSDRAHTCL